MNKIISKIGSVLSVFKRAKSKIEAAQQPVAAVRPSGRVRARDVVATAAPEVTAQPVIHPAVKPIKKSKKILVKIPSLKIGFKLDLSKIKSAFSGLADASMRSASRKEIEGFYSTKNYRAVLLSIASNKTEENFLAVKRELKAQDVLMSRFPGKIMKSRKLQGRRSIVESELNKLEIELSSKNVPARRQVSDLKSKIAELDSQVSVFRDIHKLAK